MPYRPTPPLAGLRQLRHDRGLSQDDLARQAHVARNAISELENGQRSAHARTIRRLAKVLQVKPADLYGA